ncbi:MAG: LysM peptidoglycan-binding domain-containing protein [Chlamydiia bacterium]|nr:LysM peptidoglycan-binding domain-containing protein [Chlamydiia bacterium]
MEEGRGARRLRILTIGILFSGTLNIGLIAALVASSLKDDAPVPLQTARISKQRLSATKGELLESMSKLSFMELATYLTNREPVEEGYAKRDLALSALVAFQFFNLEKALSASLPQKRLFALSEDRTIELYPALTEEQYEAVIRFAYQEKWPLISKGLFHLLKKRLPEQADESLVQAFIVTPEFHALQTLFQKTKAPREDAELVRLVCEGPWDVLDRLYREQSHVLDLSVDKRRSLLLSYLAYQSPTAARMLLQTDSTFARVHLQDAGILSLLEVLKAPFPEAERFCLELLHAPRSDAVWQAAAAKLYSYRGEAMLTPLDVQAVLRRFGALPAEPQQIAVAEPVTPKVPPKKRSVSATREHVVKEGENLWKISRLYKVKVDEIIQWNALEKEQLFPGMTLRIMGSGSSQGTGSEPPW